VSPEALAARLAELEALAQLSRNVAHDFNNQLTIILGNADLAAEQLPPDSPLLELIDAIRSTAEVGVAQSAELLEAARRTA
jgi:signal transduction histidine kinase